MNTPNESLDKYYTLCEKNGMTNELMKFSEKNCLMVSPYYIDVLNVNTYIKTCTY